MEFANFLRNFAHGVVVVSNRAAFHRGAFERSLIKQGVNVTYRHKVSFKAQKTESADPNQG